MEYISKEPLCAIMARHAAVVAAWKIRRHSTRRSILFSIREVDAVKLF